MADRSRQFKRRWGYQNGTGNTSGIGITFIDAYWTQGSELILTDSGGGGGAASIYMYAYPAGGRPIKEIWQNVVPGLVETSVAVSLALR